MWEGLNFKKLVRQNFFFCNLCWGFSLARRDPVWCLQSLLQREGARQRPWASQSLSFCVAQQEYIPSLDCISWQHFMLPQLLWQVSGAQAWGSRLHTAHAWLAAQPWTHTTNIQNTHQHRPYIERMQEWVTVSYSIWSEFTLYFTAITNNLYIVLNLHLHLPLCMQNRKPIVDYQDLKEKPLNHVQAVWWLVECV